MTCSRVKSLGYSSNKEVKIKKINNIQIKKFRSLENNSIELGSYITILVGRNGTMKTSLLALIAHPFSSSAKDVFGEELKTEKSEVFRLSDQYDNDYEYSIQIEDNNGKHIEEPVNIYIGKGEKKDRHRIVVSGSEKGDGNFKHNTSFLNLARLYPIIDTKAKVNLKINLSDTEKEQLLNFYERIFPSRDYKLFEGIQESKIKETFGPSGENRTYDFNSISSGEDNLGSIFNRLIGFQRASQEDKNIGNGVFCIDEIEAGLHPAAQIKLFYYLLEWARNNRVQVVFTTHSLVLIENIYSQLEDKLKNKKIIINFISCSEAKDDKNYPILKNPTYQLAYKELTLKTPEDVVNSKKIKIFCEDEIAVCFIKNLLKKKYITNKISFYTDKNIDKKGIEYNALYKICSVFPLLFLNEGFVVFDADVPDDILSKIKDKAIFMKIPDQDKFSIEKRIAIFITELENNNIFFKKYKMERAAFYSCFAECGIRTNIDEMKKENSTDKFKNCFKSHKNFKKYIKEYCNSIPAIREQFQKDFISKMNNVYKNLGLPQI
ncbi:AAA family ATPase [Elusimicrobiota bacterium]